MIAHNTAPSDGRLAAAPEFALAELLVDVTTDGRFAPDVPEYARRKVRAAVRHCRYPITRASARLVRRPDPAISDPVVATALVTIKGRLVRVQTTAASARAALDELQHSLRTAIERLDRHRDRHAYGTRPVHGGALDEEREIHPHGTYAPASSSVDEAIADLDALGREFHLFHDVDADVDSLVRRDGPHAYRLTRVHHHALATPTAADVSVDADDAPSLTVEAAVERLACSGEPYVFFVDASTGRGAVLHLERDGQYGLVTLG